MSRCRVNSSSSAILMLFGPKETGMGCACYRPDSWAAWCCRNDMQLLTVYHFSLCAHLVLLSSCSQQKTPQYTPSETSAYTPLLSLVYLVFLSSAHVLFVLQRWSTASHHICIDHSPWSSCAGRPTEARIFSLLLSFSLSLQPSTHIIDGRHHHHYR